MKVRLDKEDKKYITLYNHREYSVEILKASAKIANRACNSLNDHSGDLDVWIEATAYVSCADGSEFIMIGAYLSDIWQITYDNALEIASHMYVRRFKEDK